MEATENSQTTKCPKCGANIEDGLLLCPECGWEIQMVPDFEAEIDSTITDVMEDLTDKIIQTQEAIEEEVRQEKNERDSFQIHLYSSLITIVLVLAAGITILVFMGRGSIESLRTQAEKAMESQDYTQAAEAYEKLRDKDPSDDEVPLALAQTYMYLGRQRDAEAIYMDYVLYPEAHGGQFRDMAASSLVNLYLDEGDITRAYELVTGEAGEGIRDSFKSLLVEKPDFSLPQGTYEESQELSIDHPEDYDIFYTTDGSTPTADAVRYTGPITLNDGISTIKAVAINKFGIVSEVAVSTYEIAPMGEVVITPESGSLSAPAYVNVEVPSGCLVRYTSDGSEPLLTSQTYTGPLVIPLGQSHFRFLVVKEGSGTSKTIARDYDFTFEAPLTQEAAVTTLLENLIAKGDLQDMAGHSFDRPGRYIYVSSSVIDINSDGYYLMVEYYEDELGNNNRTGNLYCVDVTNGSVYRAFVDAEGHYSVVSLW